MLQTTDKRSFCTLPTAHSPLIYVFHHHLHNRRRSFALHLYPDCEAGHSLGDQGRNRRRNSGGAAGRRRLLVVEQPFNSQA